MLYFRRVVSGDLGAVTHVDGSARVQTVSRERNTPLHELLSAFAARTGVGVLCNTSLNFKGLGFINRMSHLTQYCETRGRKLGGARDLRFRGRRHLVSADRGLIGPCRPANLSPMAIQTTIVAEICAQAKEASHVLATLDAATKDAALRAVAHELEARVDEIVEANAGDLEDGRAAGLTRRAASTA